MTVLEIESPLEVRPAMEHEYIGTTGPNKRESDGIQRALDWLTEKRSVDYGWGNDTHMVILAKEVCPTIGSLTLTSVHRSENFDSVFFFDFTFAVVWRA